MSDTKYTPGPWFIDGPAPFNKNGKARYFVYISGKRWLQFAKCLVKFDGKDDPEGVANAHLIAAAPELLEACERHLANIDNWLETEIPASPEESKDIVEQLRAAIAKAKGEPA